MGETASRARISSCFETNLKLGECRLHRDSAVQSNFDTCNDHGVSYVMWSMVYEHHRRADCAFYRIFLIIPYGIVSYMYTSYILSYTMWSMVYMHHRRANRNKMERRP